MPSRLRQLNFTKGSIEALPAATSGRDYYNDSKCAGLQLQVTSTGAKTFFLYSRINGRPVRYRLGAYPFLSVENARKNADVERGRIAKGIDIQAIRKDEVRNSVTLKQAFEAFKVLRKSLKPRTLYDYGRYIDVAFKDWSDMALVKLTKDSVAKRHRRLSEQSGPAYADGAMRCLRAILNVAQHHYEAPDGTPLLPDNPVRRLSQTRAWNRVKRRTTYIKPHQLASWFTEVLNLKNDPEDIETCAIADWLLLTILTGVRRSEGLGLKWADVDLRDKTLTIRDPKNHVDHTLPLSDYLHQLLTARREKNPHGKFVFENYGNEGHLIDPRKPLERVEKASEVEFTPHDLRRTFITIAESLDIPAYALKRLLNHKMRNDVTAGYIITDVERLRKPMQQVTDFILRSAGLKPTAPVQDINQKAHA